MISAGDRRVGELFAAAVDLPPGERAAYLETACAGDVELRAEVESLIAHDRPEAILDVETPDGRPDRTHRVAADRSVRAPKSGWIAALSRPRTVVGASILAVALGVSGFFLDRTAAQRIRREIQPELQGILDASVASLHDWIDTRARELGRLAQLPQVSDHLQELAEATRGRDVSAPEIVALQSHRSLVRLFRSVISQKGVQAVGAVSRENLVIFQGNVDDQPVRATVHRVNSIGARMLSPVFIGQTIVIPPYYPGEVLAGIPITTSFTQVLVGTPVRNNGGDIIAALTVRFRSEPDLSQRLRAGNIGAATDTYAFNADGVMVSRSRHEAELKAIGLLANRDDATSVRTVAVRDPGGDLTAGFSPLGPPALRPLTRMAAHATSGESGMDLDGYRDARGKRVVGAWRWLPEYNLGIATEREYRDAYATPYWVRTVFGGLAGTLALLAICGGGVSVYRARRQRGVLKGRRLGQYRIEGVIGEGGSSTVYRARDMGLRRPVAIKLLKGGRASAEDTRRFEREVQLISRLNHPNTIRIFDYGETMEHVRFCVMELVPGITLSELVQESGPVPAARVIHLMKQVCMSLKEGHDLGIVHRDIKPGNIMLCDRADGTDIVKVLDFGLARMLAGGDQPLTADHLVGGTPIYIAPERLTNPTQVDPRSDIYSLGAVIYYLLTGRSVVEGASPEEILLKALRLDSPRPSASIGHAIPAKLDELVSRCLSLDPEGRPRSMTEVLAVLDPLIWTHPWAQDDARSWWREYRARAGASAAMRAS